MTGAARPRLHLTAASGWINDPLGLTFRDGRYHLFFQHVPGSAEWAPGCSWGHATSPDLLSWVEHDVALAPGDGDAGCWSGSVATPDGGEPVLFYTSVSEEQIQVGRVRSARPTRPDLLAWRKNPGVLVDLPADLDARTYRDPYVFADGGRWWMLVGAGLADGTATALVYASDDLASWEYRGPLASRHRDETAPVWTGSMWECPQLLAVGDRHVLVISVWDADELHSVACAVGRFAEGRFAVEGWHRLGWGAAHYAASAFTDSDGRPGLVFWLRGVADPGAGWAGAISLPYLLGLDGDRPVLAPHDALRSRRRPAEPAPAVELLWRPADGEAVRLVDDDGVPVVSLRRDGAVLRVGDEAELPHGGGAVTVVLDGPVLEVVGAAGVLAVPVRGDYRAARPEPVAGLEWWALDVTPGG
jgi:beta-fructofuranosidase